jgi:anti-sigma B factor antagonist
VVVASTASVSRPTVRVPSEFSLGFHRRGESVVVEVRGDVDAATANRLAARLHDVVAGQGNLSVVVDVGEMTFIDSQGLHALVQAWREARTRGGALRIERASASTARLLEITGLDRLLSRHDEDGA